VPPRWDWTQFSRTVSFGIGAVILVRETWPSERADPAALFAALVLMGYPVLDYFTKRGGQ
jgi:hypothetical protein